MSQPSLLELAIKYPSDKVINFGHNYIPGYTELFESKRDSATNVLEIGIGCLAHESHMQRFTNYKSGNSLRMWRDYFKNATIHAIDIYPEGMIHGEERIKTYVCDQTSESGLSNIMNNMGNIDIIIDDGSHILEHQVKSFMILEKFMKPGSIYVIEDIQPPTIPGFLSLDVFPQDFKKYIQENFIFKVFDTRHQTPFKDDMLIVFIKK